MTTSNEFAPCPIDGSKATAKRPRTPYWICPFCEVWFQSPAPPKSYEGPHEKDGAGASVGDQASEADRNANMALAKALTERWTKWQKKPLFVPGGDKPRTLDLGAKYPLLAAALMSLGCVAEAVDAIPEANAFGTVLGVPMHRFDIESFDVDAFVEAQGMYRLVTMVHVFEHMHDPIAMLGKLRKLVADDGLVFLRMPDHDAAGFERDLTENHYTIHPFFHNVQSIAEALVRARYPFRIAETYQLAPGQRDVILRPAKAPPTIYAGIIAKNEQRDLPRALESIRGVVDGVVFVDTGSTDNTVALAHKHAKIRHYETYTGSSVKNERGEWLLEHFADARNRAVDATDVARRNGSGSDYFMWFDADDELVTPHTLRRALTCDPEVIGVTIQDGDSRWVHHRLWKTGKGVRFEGACHEYPRFDGLRAETFRNIVIRHHGKPSGGESSNARNLRILTKEIAKQREENRVSSRAIFYLAQTHRDGNRFKEAAEAYEERVTMGPSGHPDEWLFARLYGARCLATFDLPKSRMWLLRGMSDAPSWSEFPFELARQAYRAGKYQECMGWCHLAFQPENIPPTQLWREPNAYTDQPLRLISWCHEHMGNIKEALSAAWLVREHVANDQEWEDRIKRLSASFSEQKRNPEFSERSVEQVFPPKTAPVVLHRPGAIGDVLMTLNLIPLLRKQWGKERPITYVCDSRIAVLLAPLFEQLGVDTASNIHEVTAQDHAAIYNLVGYPLAEGYPNVPMKEHLIHAFRKEMRLPWDGDPNDLPRARFKAFPLPKALEADTLPFESGGIVTVQVKTGWSVYKEWPLERWSEVCEAIRKERYLPVQVGGPDDPMIPEAFPGLLGNMKLCIAAVSHAACHVGLDSFANHLTHYEWTNDIGESWQTPSVVLWGSTQASASGYAKNRNLSLGLKCQPCFREDPKISRMPRGVCPNPPGQTYEQPKHACMQGLTTDVVIQAVRDTLREKQDR